jgi:hypothetical protein
MAAGDERLSQSTSRRTRIHQTASGLPGSPGSWSATARHARHCIRHLSPSRAASQRRHPRTSRRFGSDEECVVDPASSSSREPSRSARTPTDPTNVRPRLYPAAMQRRIVRVCGAKPSLNSGETSSSALAPDAQGLWRRCCPRSSNLLPGSAGSRRRCCNRSVGRRACRTSVVRRCPRRGGTES